MQSLLFSYKNKPILGFIITLFIVFNSNSYAQKMKLLKPVKIDSISKTKISSKKKNKEKLIIYNGYDGPFVINDSLLYHVTKNNELIQNSNFDKDSITVLVDNKDEDQFFVSLVDNYENPKSEHNMPDKMVVISDIEGNFNGFASFLYANEIIDKNFNWIFGDGHLVLNGDFVDRGNHVTQVLWLIYKLDHQAKAQDGMVHFILGNHEILNFHGDHRYNRGKTIKVAKDISKLENEEEALRFLYSKNSEIGKWLSTKNVIERIGNYIFTHAGLSTKILKYDLDLKEINKKVRKKYYNLDKVKDEKLKFLYSSKGPFWYRGLARESVSSEDLDKILKHFKAQKIVIGHTPVDSISTKYDGKLINTDVHHGYEKFSGKTYGILIENNKEYVIDDTNFIKALER